MMTPSNGATSPEEPKEYDQHTKAVDVIREPVKIRLPLSRDMKAALEAAIAKPTRQPGDRQVRMSVSAEPLADADMFAGIVFLNLPKRNESPLTSKHPHFLGSFYSGHAGEYGEKRPQKFYLDVVRTLRKLRRPVPEALRLTFLPAPVRETEEPVGYRIKEVRLTIAEPKSDAVADANR
jgi:hypothetical protein